MNKAYIFFLFLVFAAIGTILHESGHFIAILLVNCKPALHYNCVTLNCEKEFSNAQLAFTRLSGPFVDILIGSIGFAALFKKYKTEKENEILLLAAISFFWSREITVLLVDLLVKPLLRISSGYVSDEQRASLELFAQPYWFSVILGLLGLWVCSVVVFRLIHKKDRLSFIVFGALGSLAGYVLWFKLLGPKLLP